MVLAKKLSLAALVVAAALSAPFSEASVPVTAGKSLEQANFSGMVCFWEGHRSVCIWVE